MMSGGEERDDKIITIIIKIIIIKELKN